MALALVTLAQAKQRCRIVSADENADLQLMIEEATAAVLARVDDPAVTDFWVDQAATPPEAQAAILELVLSLYERDTTLQTDDHRGMLPARVERLLTRLIEPALA